MTEREVFGLLVVDKPVGPTSHDIVDLVRTQSGVRKVGHSGTLDPAASGVLVLCLGPATRLSEYLTASDKAYEALIRFGRETDTYDADGQTISDSGQAPSLEQIESALPDYQGTFEQVPPAFSAVKRGGAKAYELARAGKAPQLAPRQVTIYELDVRGYDPPDLQLRIRCSSGTYIRSLAFDLGRRVGMGAHLAGLRRTAVGGFTLDQAVSPDEVRAAAAAGELAKLVRPPAEALPGWPLVRLEGEALTRVRHGQSVEAAAAEGMALGMDDAGQLVALLEAAPDGGSWQPNKVLLP
ncbi:MAG TPA: tRNA pseudouridine(55) synthase TruB [Anaerolineales bacterium]|jgi:tRNA pseudouridine55 synthase